MDVSAIVVKIVGAVLFLFTARSVYRHIKQKIAAKRNFEPAADKTEQSKIEHVLNSILLYAWYVFMTLFSLGMIFNN